MRLALALATALLLIGCDIEDFDAYRADFHYDYELQPGCRFEIDNPNGNVEIEGWDKHSVDISGTKFAGHERQLDDVRIDIRHTPDSIAIRTTQPSFFYSGGARYTIRMPRDAVIERIRSTNGNILLRNVGGAASEITHLRSVNGTIEAEHIRGAIEAETTNGRIELRDFAGGCDAHTVNGSVDLTLREKPLDPIRAQTVNGGITLRLPGDVEVYEHVREDNRRHNHVEGTLGSAGPELRLATVNGGINILKGF